MVEENPLDELKHEPSTPVIDKPDEKAEEKGETEEKKRSRIAQTIGEYKRKLRETELAAQEKDRIIQELKEKTLLKKEPDKDDYSDYEKYQNDKKQWEQQKEIEIEAKVTQKLRQKALEREQQVKAEETAKRWAKESAIGKKTYENFDKSEEEVIAVVRDYGAGTIRDYIVEHDEKGMGSALVDYLGNNLDKLEKIATLSPTAQAREMARIEKTLEAKPTKTVSSAPDPVNSVRGSASVSVNPSNESVSDYIRRKNGFK